MDLDMRTNKAKYHVNYPLCTQYEIYKFIDSMWEGVESLYALRTITGDIMYSTLSGVRKTMADDLMKRKALFHREKMFEYIPKYKYT